MTFEPEPGQAIFSNTEWQEFRMDYDVERALLTIGDALVRAGLVEENPCFNSGEIYEGHVFQMRAYCWCDGDGDHSEGCPPNFQWRDFSCAWYKHVGRGNSQNRFLAPGELDELLLDCLSSIRRPMVIPLPEEEETE